MSGSKGAGEEVAVAVVAGGEKGDAGDFEPRGEAVGLNVMAEAGDEAEGGVERLVGKPLPLDGAGACGGDRSSARRLA